MITKLNIEAEANKLATAASSKAILDHKFGIDYKIANVTEEILTANNFNYIGKSIYSFYPIYQKENLFGVFEDGIFILGEGNFKGEI